MGAASSRRGPDAKMSLCRSGPGRPAYVVRVPGSLYMVKPPPARVRRRRTGRGRPWRSDLAADDVVADLSGGKKASNGPRGHAEDGAASLTDIHCGAGWSIMLVCAM